MCLDIIEIKVKDCIVNLNKTDYGPYIFNDIFLLSKEKIFRKIVDNIQIGLSFDSIKLYVDSSIDDVCNSILDNIREGICIKSKENKNREYAGNLSALVEIKDILSDYC
jgi:hypothetical protein